jgi:hypothetical protein
MRIFSVVLIFVFFWSCQSKKNKTLSFEPQFIPGPSAIVYKTKNNYNDLVAVILSDDKSEIISYPSPTDVKKEGYSPNPIILKNGYLLDNRGINPNVAFINLTYQQYGELKEVPSLKTMFEMIVDKDPLLEMCNCGNRDSIQNTEAKLNYLIKNNLLTEKCKKIK